MRRLLLVLALVAAVAAAPARAQEEPPPPPPPPPVAAPGVTVAGVDVGGMTAEEVRAAAEAAFAQALVFRFKAREWRVAPRALGSYPYLNTAVREALAAPPGTKVRLNVRIHLGKIRAYSERLDRVYSRAPRDSRIVLRGATPYVTRSRPGRTVRKAEMTDRIRRALVRTDRAPIRLAVKPIAPRVTRATIGPIVVIRRESRRLYLYRGMSLVRIFPVAVGKPAYPTPLGRFGVVSKIRHPTWNPPSSAWAAGLGPVPPGPANPLGTRWIGISAPGIGIHGTPQPSSIGTAASHGCIRMYMRDVEWLFERVSIGTPVFVVRA